MEVIYRATPTLAEFHRSNAFYRGVMGPVGSGKSTAMCMEIIRRAQEQKPNSEGVRKTRFAIVRNTYRELEDTTKKTWLDWFPEERFGPFNNTDMVHNISFNDVRCEVLFRALDKPKDIKKLLSLELTGAWVNEAKEVPKGIVDTLGDRVGRYPSMRDGGATWSGVFMDTNPPDDDHWWYTWAEGEQNGDYAFFKQPGGLVEIKEGGKSRFVDNPSAENKQNLPANYYVTRMAGKNADHIRVYYCSQYGFVRDGQPVIHNYIDALHCADTEIPPMKNVAIKIGVDFGLTPAATFWQWLPNGQWLGIDELVSEHMGIKRFTEMLCTHIKQNYKDFKFDDLIGDPAGVSESQTQEETCFQIMNQVFQDQKMPIYARPAPTNDATVRHESLNNCLARYIDGRPGLIISPKMKITRKGLAGGYCYKRLQVAGDAKYQNKPDKNKYSHPVESAEYALIGAGEGFTLVYGNNDDEYYEDDHLDETRSKVGGY
jgi:hypothetical protein